MFKKFYLSLFFSREFYTLLVVDIILFVLSYGIEFLFGIAQLFLLLLVMAVVADYAILFYRRHPLSVLRMMSEAFSNGDENKISISIVNHYPFQVRLRIIDELPVQFQMRGFVLPAVLRAGEEIEIPYLLKPLSRGEYVFYDINVYIKSPLRLVIRRNTTKAERMVKVLPSFFSLRQYELMAHSNNLSESGNRRIRKLGQSLEFEQIKEYVTGDDLRGINWKATARKGGQLMVNNYTDEKSQQVYCVIDTGRVMKMPFEGMTLLDYAINATLILSRVALIKRDKAGIVTFGEKIYNVLPADHKALQMASILEVLYNQQSSFPETDFEKLFVLTRTRITQRSLIVLFTNFESLSALQRQLPYIRSIARSHLLLIVFFENTELRQLTDQKVRDVESLYIKTIAEKFVYEKRMMVKELQKHGIATILTAPQNLTVNTVNKYLEIKARLAI